ALRAALVKRHEHEHAFDTVFDLFFSPAADPPPGIEAVPEEGNARGTPGTAVPGLATLDDERLIELLVEALRAEDFTTVRFIAGIFVDRHARIEPGRPVGGMYYLFRTMRAIDQDALLGRLLDGSYDEGPEGALTRRLAVDRAEWLIDRLRSEVEAQNRPRLVADRGAGAGGKTRRTPLPQDAGCPPRPEPGAPATRQPGLPPHRATVDVHRRSARSAGLPQAAGRQARADGDRRHLGVGRGVRHLHAAARGRAAFGVRRRPDVRVRGRHRRGDLGAGPGLRHRGCDRQDQRCGQRGMAGRP